MIRVTASRALRLAASGVRPLLPDRPMRVLVWGFGLECATRRQALQRRAMRAAHDFSDAESQRVLGMATRSVAYELGREAAREYLASMIRQPEGP